MRKAVVLIAVACVSALFLASTIPAAGAVGEATKLAPPPDGQSYFGFTFRLFDTAEPVWGDARPLAERLRDSIDHELAGKTPTFVLVWAPWQHPDAPARPLVPFGDAVGDLARARAAVGDGGTVYFDWNLASTTLSNRGITTKDIAAGRLDRYVRHYARAIRDYGQPLLVRLFNGEFNGDWWAGVSPKANGYLTTDHFVGAWRRVVDIFRAVGVGNVSWAWIPAAWPRDPSAQPQIDRNINAYYPGDEYVDWVGADFYDVGAVDWLDGPYAFALAHRKPFFVGEFGIRHEWSSLTPAQWAPWLASAFDYFDTHPAIKGISYFNLNNRGAATRVHWDPGLSLYLDGGLVDYVPNVNDHDSRLLAGGPAVQAVFSSRIAAPRYVSTVLKTTVQTETLSATAALLTSRVRGRAATIRWTGDLATDTFDVELRHARGGWRRMRTSTPSTAMRIRSSPRARVTVRVRGRDVYGGAGPWSAVQVVKLP